MTERCEMSGYTKLGKVKKNAICNNHTFVMKPVCTVAKMRSQTKINLCPVLNKYRLSQRRTNNKVENIFPVYNGDGKGHLPAFLLESDIVRIGPMAELLSNA